MKENFKSLVGQVVKDVFRTKPNKDAHSSYSTDNDIFPQPHQSDQKDKDSKPEPIVNIKNGGDYEMKNNQEEQKKRTPGSTTVAEKELPASEYNESSVHHEENHSASALITELLPESEIDSPTAADSIEEVQRVDEAVETVKDEKDEKIASLEIIIAEQDKRLLKIDKLESELKALSELVNVQNTRPASAETKPEAEVESVSDIPEADVPPAAKENHSAKLAFEKEFAKLSEQVGQISNELISKMRQDESKNRIIDNLHRELQGFKENQKKELVKSMILDLIRMIDRLKLLADEYEKAGEQYPKILVNVIKDMVQDIEDILSREGIDAYNCEGQTVDTKRQSIVKTVKVDDPAKDKTIAEVVGNGYIWDGVIVRSERIKVYVYELPKSK